MQIDPIYFLIFTIVVFVSLIITAYFANLYFKRKEQIEEEAKEVVNIYISSFSEKLKLHQNSIIEYMKSRTKFVERFEKDFFEDFEKMQNSQKNIQEDIEDTKNDIKNLIDRIEAYEEQFRRQNIKILELQDAIKERNGIINYKNNKIAKLQNKINALENEINKIKLRIVDGD